MKIFSEEYLQQLRDEHDLITKACLRLRMQGRPQVDVYGAAGVAQAIGNLTARRIELEAMIESLGDFLHG